MCEEIDGGQVLGVETDDRFYVVPVWASNVEASHTGEQSSQKMVQNVR